MAGNQEGVDIWATPGKQGDWGASSYKTKSGSSQRRKKESRWVPLAETSLTPYYDEDRFLKELNQQLRTTGVANLPLKQKGYGGNVFSFDLKRDSNGQILVEVAGKEPGALGKLIQWARGER